MATKEYLRNYYLNNKEKLSEYSKKWRRKHMDELREYQKNWREKHRLKCNEYQRELRKKNRNKCREFSKKYNLKNREYHKEYYEKNKGKYTLSNKKRRQENKAKVIKFLGGKCIRCGIIYDGKNACIFQLHHRSQEEKKMRRNQKIISDNGMDYTNWITTEKELKFCDLYCANCHFREHSEEY